MPTTPGTGDRIGRGADEQFLDLVCSDMDFLRAEFNAIIAANWPGPAARSPSRGGGAGRPNTGPRREPVARIAAPMARPRHRAAGGWTRQRSPPARDNTPTGRQGGDRLT
jgi:hypothetical protein